MASEEIIYLRKIKIQFKKRVVEKSHKIITAKTSVFKYWKTIICKELLFLTLYVN
ncbi:hypothetical protein SAMN02910340_00255 [Methanosarcina thermophila]|jgi:hypothetical protein|uniref:Uncharacterized protein n=1 Tax=Methanosarcina thermophila TaxID=2210 RepID=A0A1I6X6W8_METTE|nr:hypothetical protein SAMN02910340_00255 [Methanosarcina thermophila]